MMIELVCYLRKVKLARLPQIAQHLQQKPALIESMLAILVQQKRVSCYSNSVACETSCCGCPMAKFEPVYYWNYNTFKNIKINTA